MNQPMNGFRPLGLSTLRPGTGYARAFFYTPNRVMVGSSALEVMTDLRFVPAVTIGGEASIEGATEKMIVRGVRCLLVVDVAEDVIGIVTSRDLIGKRLEAAIDRHGDSSSLRVSEIMTIAENIEVIPLDQVLHARVGDIIETLKHSGRQHALAVEEEPFSGKHLIRGIFSASQIARQLGVALSRHELSQTFEKIDKAICAQQGE